MEQLRGRAAKVLLGQLWLGMAVRIMHEAGDARRDGGGDSVGLRTI